MKRSLVLLLLLAGCDPFPESEEFRVIDPPPEYRIAWDAVTDCTGIEADFRRVDWREVLQEPWTDNCALMKRDEPRPCTGRWAEPHTIYLATANVMNRGTVQHEVIHDRIRQRHNDGNDWVFERCDYRGTDWLVGE